jgi:tetratricopeptide (TPR) repeat protein
LTKAITIVPNYANAQYFLGLSDEYLAKHDEAIAQFEALSKTNPDNADVQSILGNLQAGRDPLYKSPAGTKNPVNRPTPPITSQP